MIAWLLPARLDWGRYRPTVEEVAGRELGGTVRIEGPISLALLPQPVLTAERVRVTGAGGAGIALDVGALRLEVALAALLRGRIVPRALVLSGPELRVPWPLPDHFRPGTPDWRGPFAARIEHGRVVIGRLVLAGIDATLGRAEEDGGLSASGTAEASGIAWRVTAQLREPAADGGRGLGLALDGQGRANGLGATFDGEIEPDGAVAGRIAARGPDLSLLLPAPSAPFRLEGRARAAGGLASAEDLALVVGGSPARGSAALRVSPIERLDVSLDAGRLDLDRWSAALARSDARVLQSPIPVHLDLSADAAEAGGGTLRRLRAAIDWADGAMLLRQAEALLPGEAALRGAGRITPAASASTDGGPGFDGRASLSAPDGRATARWLAGLGVPGLQSLPPGVGQSADVSASVSAGPGRLALTDLSGRVDGSAVSGALELRPGSPARMDADLRFDRLALDAWVPGPMPEPASLPAMLTGRLRVAAAHAWLRGVGIDNLLLDAEGGGGSLVVRELGGTAAGVQVAASGAVGAGGRITDGKLRMSADDASALERLAPPAWRGVPAFREGPVVLEAAVVGPPEALAARLALDWADARLEASPAIDWPHRSWRGPATMRHPGAARLLRSAGFPSADWLGEGSFALAGRFAGKPGVLAAESFDLTAGLMRAHGELVLDRTGQPRLSGRVAADTLPVPVPSLSDPEPVGFDRLRGWNASVRVEAATVFAARAPDRPIGQAASATVTLAGGALRFDPVSLQLGEARISGTVGLDAGGETPALAATASLTDLQAAGPATGWPIDVTAGRGEARVRLAGAGHSPAALAATASGAISLVLRDGVLAGFDLPALRSAVAAGANGLEEDAAARAALEGGATPFRSLIWDVAIANGVATFGDATVLSPDGTVSLAGTIALPGSGVREAADLRIALRPDLGPGAADPPAIGLRLDGPVQAPRRTPELGAFAKWQAERVPR